MLIKDRLREQFRKQRQALDPASRQIWSDQIMSRLQAWLLSQDVDLILGFRSYGEEVNINPLVDRLSQTLPFALPVVKAKGQMEFYRYQAGDQLIANRWGIEEPAPNSKPIEPTARTIILVPALAICFQAYRLGYGGGFYDRYFERYPSLTSLGIIFEEFFISSLPVEPHDAALQYVVHQNGLLKF